MRVEPTTRLLQLAITKHSSTNGTNSTKGDHKDNMEGKPF
jgi:hypothetical protein